MVSRCYSDLLTSDPVPPTSRDRFSDELIERLWNHSVEPWVDTALIFIYSGWRISELLGLKTVDIDLQAGTMKGVTKTKAGTPEKSRVPASAWLFYHKCGSFQKYWPA